MTDPEALEHRLRRLELAGRLEHQLRTRAAVKVGHDGHAIVQIDVLDVLAAIASLREQESRHDA
jgi:hypothetical protein